MDRIEVLRRPWCDIVDSWLSDSDIMIVPTVTLMQVRLARNMAIQRFNAQLIAIAAS
jgi:hypothetical protein